MPLLIEHISSLMPIMQTTWGTPGYRGDLPYTSRLIFDLLSGTSKRLTSHLLAHHDKRAPPDGVVDIHYEMDLVHILGIDELRQTMTCLVYVDEVRY